MNSGSDIQEERKFGSLLPAEVKEILHTLDQNGFYGCVVGGCVRDFLLGREPADWDIACSASPSEIRALFRRTLDTGISHGTVTVMMGKKGYELTSFRLPPDYRSHGVSSREEGYAMLCEDLSRRDFTINAIAYREDRGFIDLWEGRRDLQLGRIRCVLDPDSRFREDPLRTLRAVRFCAQLGFAPDEDTKAAIRHFAGDLEKVSPERIRTELSKILLSPAPSALRTAWEMGLTAAFLPEFDRCMDTAQNSPHHCFSVGEHILHSMEEVPPELVLRLTMLLHDIAKPLVKTTDESGVDHFKGHPEKGRTMAEQILKRLKYDNDTIRRVTFLVYWHDYRPELTETAVRRAMSRLTDSFDDFLKVQKADVLAQSSFLREEKLRRIREAEEISRGIRSRKECITLKELAVSGRDLLDDGFAAGREMGDMLKLLLEHVIAFPEDNRKEILLEIARKERFRRKA